MVRKLEDKLFEYLKLFWLRPENGIMCAFKSRVFEDIKIEGPSLDVSCADGLFMFIHLGGSFGMDFDIFKATKAKEFSHDKFVDIFDNFEQGYVPSITKRPQSTMSYGTDWKQGLLDKAASLKLYDNLVLHDNNQVPMPLPDDYFKTVYSNSIYWVKNVDGLVKDIHRSMQCGGRAILEVKTPSLLDTLDQLEPVLSSEAIEILDRKRRETMPGSMSLDQWNELFKNAGFEIEDVRSVYPDKLLIDIWNVGLRPVAHLLVRMADAISAEERNAIKTEWVDIFFKLLKPLLNLKQTYTLDKAPYLCFVLRK